jgi:hypothetical protein
MREIKEPAQVIRRTSKGVYRGVDFYPNALYANLVMLLARKNGTKVRSFRNEAQGYTVLLVPSYQPAYDDNFQKIQDAEQMIPSTMVLAIDSVSEETARHIIAGFVEAK